MSDAAEVLAAVFERLEASEAGRAMVRAVFGCHIREQLHCYNCSRDTHPSAYCQFLYNASAAGIRRSPTAPSTARCTCWPSTA